jgi:type IV secretory pathway VirB4 component
VVLGRQGAGKTFLSQLFVLWTLYQNGRATIVDRAGHYRALINLVGGTYVALGKDPAPPVINPWDVRPGEDLRKKIDALLALHEIMLTRPGQEVDARTEAAVERAIKGVYAEHARRRKNGELPDQPAPLERDLLAYLDREACSDGLTNVERDIRRALLDTLQPYAGDGRYAPITDRPTTVDLETALLCFDLDGLPERLYALTMFIIADAMARRAVNTYDRRRVAERQGAGATPGDQHPELLCIDEGWFLARYAGAGPGWTTWRAAAGIWACALSLPRSNCPT